MLRQNSGAQMLAPRLVASLSPGGAEPGASDPLGLLVALENCITEGFPSNMDVS